MRDGAAPNGAAFFVSRTDPTLSLQGEEALSEIGDEMEPDEPRRAEGVADRPANTAETEDPKAVTPSEPSETDVGVPLEPGWDGVKRDVLYSGKSRRRIARDNGVTERTLRRRIEQEGWIRVVPMQPAKSGPKPRQPGMPARAGAQSLRRKRIVARLFQVLDHKMRLLEERMTAVVREGAVPQSAADTERDARSFTALMRVYAKLVEIDEAAKPPAEEGSETERARSGDDADRFRRELALRIQRLNSGGDG